jgi:hypothetical protein
MPARSPEVLDHLFADALNVGNVDALVAPGRHGVALT